MNTYLGIDGGGSVTRALLVDDEGSEIYRAESGPSNLNTTKAKDVRTSLNAVIDECIRQADTPPVASCIGLAGVGHSSTREVIEALLPADRLGKTLLTTDAKIAIHGAFDGGPGILLIAGTGSICMAKDHEGKIYRSGGWGWLADDAGSAGWIGQRALEAALQQNDGRIDGHLLRDEVFEALSISSNEEIRAQIYQPHLTRAQLANLAKCVIKLSKGQDEVAKRILKEAIFELEKLVRATSAKLATGDRNVAFSGGLLERNEIVSKQLEVSLSDHSIQPAQLTPLEGAVSLAKSLVVA
ncbi:MAG: N-acetylglucosamine kinase [Opitutales bacterium]